MRSCFFFFRGGGGEGLKRYIGAPFFILAVGAVLMVILFSDM